MITASDHVICASDHVICASLFRIPLVNANKLAENCDLFTITKEVLSRKLHFLCRDSTYLLISISHSASYNGYLDY